MLESSSYYGRLKQMIKEANYDQILFHIKGIIDEPIVEIDIHDLYAFAMTKLRIPNGKPKIINDSMLYNDIVVTDPEPEQIGYCDLPRNLMIDDSITEPKKLAYCLP
jgi:hypothetical protein